MTERAGIAWVLAVVGLVVLVASLTVLPWQTKVDTEDRQDLAFVVDYIDYSESDGSEVAAGTYDYVAWGIYVASVVAALGVLVALFGRLRRTVIVVELLVAAHHAIWSWKVAEVFHGGLAIGVYGVEAAYLLWAAAAAFSPKGVHLRKGAPTAPD